MRPPMLVTAEALQRWRLPVSATYLTKALSRGRTARAVAQALQRRALQPCFARPFPIPKPSHAGAQPGRLRRRCSGVRCSGWWAGAARLARDLTWPSASPTHAHTLQKPCQRLLCKNLAFCSMTLRT